MPDENTPDALAAQWQAEDAAADAWFAEGRAKGTAAAAALTAAVLAAEPALEAIGTAVSMACNSRDERPVWLAEDDRDEIRDEIAAMTESLKRVRRIARDHEAEVARRIRREYGDG